MTTPMARPLVSICIPTYNGATFLAAAIDSVLNQTYGDFELWVVDDKSTDNTPAMVARYADPRLHYLRNAQNLGPQGNWNRCLELVQGKYFKLLPHDDLLATDCLKNQVAILEADTSKELALVFGSREIIGPEGQFIMKRGLSGSTTGRISARSLAKRCIRAGTNLIGEPGNGLIRSEVIPKVGAYDARYPYLVDLDYWFRVLLQGDAYYLSARTSSFRISSGSWSVAIGGKQYQDFKGFVDKYRTESLLEISRIDGTVGLLRARLNTVARALVYRFLFFGK